MGLSMMFYYRRNLNGIPESIQRAMHNAPIITLNILILSPT